MNKNVRQILLPLIASFIWGSAFIFQKQASNADIGAFTYNALRSIVAAVVLTIIILIKNSISEKRLTFKIKHSKEYKKDLLIGGTICGICLTCAVNLQQYALYTSTAGKAGFLTALYIVLVPLLSIFLKKKVSFSGWIAVILACFGLYFLCIKNNFSIVLPDILLLLCALFFSIHIITVSHYSLKVDGFELSCFQFVICFIASSIIALFFEGPLTISIIKDCYLSILYVGIFSSAIGYTLQILAQKGTNPTVVSLIMSLEAFFSTVLGAIMLNEILTRKEYIGCILMLAAVLISQVPSKKSI